MFLAAAMDGWCIVVVGDEKTKDDWLTSSEELKNNKSVFFFKTTINQKLTMADTSVLVFSFFSSFPLDALVRLCLIVV
jgi:hypothetical protein